MADFLKSGTNLVLALLGMGILSGCDNPERQERYVEKTFSVHTGLGEQIKPLFIPQTGTVIVHGVWTIEGDDKIADPINISSITCYQNGGYCEDHRAWITSGAPISHPTLMQSSDLYEIKSYDDSHVIAELVDQCRIIQLDISANAVTAVTKEVPGCSEIANNAPDKPRLSRLITGSELDAMRKK